MIETVKPHDHVVIVYNTSEEIIDILGPMPKDDAEEVTEKIAEFDIDLYPGVWPIIPASVLLDKLKEEYGGA